MSQDLRTFIEQVTGDSHLRVEADLGDGFVRLRSAEAERRQAKHDIRSSEDIVIEMLRNARDAHAGNIYVASWKEGSLRFITMLDDGDGIPESMFERIFEARVTSKLDSMHMDLWGVHGRGMALYAVKVNADSAQVIASKVDGGSAFSVTTDTAKLGEKRDQSTTPTFIIDENGTVTVRGPRNINRTVSEFAYIERDTCSVYFGSVAEIAATLWHYGRSVVSRSLVAFCNDPNDLAICKRLALSTTPDEFAAIAESLGLPLSSRTARRIMDGEIVPLKPVDKLLSLSSINNEGNIEETKSKAEIEPEPSEPKQHDTSERDVLSSVLFKDTRGLRVAESDRKEFKESVAKAYKQLAKAYYLEEDVEPEVRFRRDRIDVFIPVQKQD